MKKIISFVLALALACSFSSTAFAASVTEESDQKSGYTEIVYTAHSVPACAMCVSPQQPAPTSMSLYTASSLTVPGYGKNTSIH